MGDRPERIKRATRQNTEYRLIANTSTLEVIIKLPTMLDKRVNKQNVLEALIFIDKNGVPKKRNSTKFTLHHDNKIYPPKYVLSIATKFAAGKELDPKVFNGGDETNSFLMSLGFTIKEGNKQL